MLRAVNELGSRTMRLVNPRSRRRCWCGCKRRATHKGFADGVALTTGCEVYVRRWLRDPVAARMAVFRLRDKK